MTYGIKHAPLPAVANRATSCDWLDVERAITGTQALLDTSDAPLDCRAIHLGLGEVDARQEVLLILDAVDGLLRPSGRAIVLTASEGDFLEWRIDAPENCTGTDSFPCDQIDGHLEFVARVDRNDDEDALRAMLDRTTCEASDA